jgi:uncharacterized SAM-binding protein YcdF (DUF218 family)
MTSQRTNPSAPTKLSRSRRIVIWTLVVLASLIALIGTVTLWVNRQVLDEQSWRKASEDVINDPQIKNALSVFLVNQLYDNIDMKAAIAERLPPNAQQAAGTIAAALRTPATNAVNQLLSRPRVQQLFIDASSTAHEKLVNVLEDHTGHGISTGNGVVTIDLKEILTQLAQQIGLSGERIAQLPPDAGVITIMTSSQLGTVQKGVKAIHVLSAWLLVAVLVLYALAIYLARGHRREVLRNIGFAFAAVGLIVLLVRRLVGNYAVDTLAEPGYRGPVRDLYLIGSAILHQMGIAAVAYGLIAAAGAIFAGPTRWATAARRSIAPTLNENQGIVWGALAGVVLLLAVWGPTHALRTWWGVLLFAGLLAAGLVALRHQTLREFPSESEAAAPEVTAAGEAPATPPVSPPAG